MIGLDSNVITIDIHESKVPLSLYPEFVDIYHDGKLVHNGKISYGYIPGKVTIDVKESKMNFDDIFRSAGSYIPFTINFMAYSKSDKFVDNKGIY